MSMIGNFLAVSESEIASLLADAENGPLLIERAYDSKTNRPMNIGKAWAGIHYLLTGTEYGGDPPLNFILSGNPVGDVDLGYGPGRLQHPEDVAIISNAIAFIDRNRLHERFDSRKMSAESIYPSIWHEGEKAFDYCANYFEELKKYYADAAAQSKGMLLWVS